MLIIHIRATPSCFIQGQCWSLRNHRTACSSALSSIQSNLTRQTKNSIKHRYKYLVQGHIAGWWKQVFLPHWDLLPPLTENCCLFKLPLQYLFLFLKAIGYEIPFQNDQCMLVYDSLQFLSLNKALMCLHTALQTERNSQCPHQTKKMLYSCGILKLTNPSKRLDSLDEAHTDYIQQLFLSLKHKQSKFTTALNLGKSKFLSHHLLFIWV